MPSSSRGGGGAGTPDVSSNLLYHPSDVDGGAVPAFNREDTMYLDSVRPRDLPRGRLTFPKDVHLSLETADIAGARTPAHAAGRLFLTPATPRETIPGSTVRKIYPEVNRVTDFSLKTEDLPRAKSCAVQLKTGRCVNPLEPEYQLPSYQLVPEPPVRQMIHEGQPRDTLSFKGEATARILERNHARDPNEHRDIEGSQPNFAGRVGGRKRDSFTPRDTLWTLEQAGGRVLSSFTSTERSAFRETCPLNPVYTTAGQTTHPFLSGEGRDTGLAPRSVGPVPGSTPRERHRGNGEPQHSLIRRDIAGAVPQRFKGRVPFNICDPPEVTPFANHLGLDCSDIPGAQPGTRKPGTNV
eukprot:TRINITY_DN12670_c0_g1_i1.p1 TRINITY_DN12670_c0_g1~~TRINITY_DN12670_c0_g1_i1.p1  ORF type:complete len:380 (+),score=43.63 TRINITY_DN12670_c0_g1_i1:79-1140(+)